MTTDLKYRPGRGPRRTSGDRPIGTIEKITIAHVGIFVLLATWYFGGASPSARTALSWWGTLGVLLLTVVLGDKHLRAAANLRPLKWLWPFGLFNLVVLVSCLVPNFRTISFGTEAGDLGYVKVEGLSSWIPSTAMPGASLARLWLFDVTYLSTFQILVSVNQRRTLRWLLGLAGLNAIVLAIFGTLQKLGHAKGLFFGSVPSPQPSFFASFVYDNHWGAYVILMTAICLGAIVRILRRQSARDFFHSPAAMAVIGVLVLAISVPLSNSRACTLLMILLMGVALISWLITSVRRRRQQKESAVLPVALAVAVVAIALGAVWYVAQDSIRNRLETTKSQLAEVQAKGSVGQRQTLYRDTLTMAEDKPVFGWGMGSYPYVFMVYNTAESKADDLPVFFNDAHSDWLQSFAEHGVVGSLLLALCLLVPLSKIRGSRVPGPIPGYLLGGCAIVLAYALIEFPFGNAAVVLCWWICLFCAVRYTILESAPAKKAA